MGSDRAPAKLQGVREHAEAHSALVCVVHADWLRASAQRRAREGEEGWALGSAELGSAGQPSQAPERASSQAAPEEAEAGSRGGLTAADGEGARSGAWLPIGPSILSQQKENDTCEVPRVFNDHTACFWLHQFIIITSYCYYHHYYN